MKKIFSLSVIIVQFALQAQNNSEAALYPMNVGGKFGYADVSGKTVIAPKFTGAEIFSDGLGKVDAGNKCAYINSKGDYVFKEQFFQATDFSDGAAFVSQKTGAVQKWSVIDKSGKLFPIPDFDYKNNFYEGLCRVKTKEGLWGFIDKQGKYRVEPKYQGAGDFSEGLACVYINKRWGFIDTNGTMVIEPQFNTVGNMKFSGGLAAVRLPQDRENGLYKIGFINKKGELQNTDWIKKIDDENVYELRSLSGPTEGVSVLYSSPGKYAVVNTDGEVLMDFREYELLYEFHNGLAAFQEKNENNNGKWGFINSKGEVIIKAQFTIVTDFDKNGIALYQKKEGNLITSGYMDKTGKAITKFSFKD